MDENKTNTTTLAFGDMSVNVHKNIDQDFIYISEDRLKLKLIEYENCRKKIYDWISPLAIFITLVIALITAEFKSALLLPGAVWNAIFVLLTIAAFIWLMVSLCNIIHNNKITIDSVIEEIKQKKPTQ